MSNTKIIMALVALAALALVVVGLVSAQTVNQTVPGTTTSTTAPNSGGFFGWIGRCFDFRAAQQYYGTNTYIAPQVPPTNTTAQDPYVNQPVQGYYGYGRGCWGRFIP